MLATLCSTARWDEDVRFLLCCTWFQSDVTNNVIGTTTGMVVACLVASTANWDKSQDTVPSPEENGLETYDSIDGPSEEEAYLQGVLKPPQFSRIPLIMR